MQLDIPNKRAIESVGIQLERFKSILEPGEDVWASGSGNFCVKIGAVRKARNLAAGDASLPARRMAASMRSGRLRGRSNGGSGNQDRNKLNKRRH